MRLVVDTNAVVAAVRSPTGASAELLKRIRLRRVIMLSSVPLFIEYEAVLSRPEHRLAASASSVEIETVLDALALLVEPVRIAYLWRPRLRDAADDMVLEAAANGRADAIVTFNKADFGASPAQFGIDIVTPADILRRL